MQLEGLQVLIGVLVHRKADNVFHFTRRVTPKQTPMHPTRVLNMALAYAENASQLEAVSDDLNFGSTNAVSTHVDTHPNKESHLNGLSTQRLARNSDEQDVASQSTLACLGVLCSLERSETSWTDQSLSTASILSRLHALH